MQAQLLWDDKIMKDDLINDLATTISDYREGEITPPDNAHVERWINQFELHEHIPILQEMNHILSKSYFSKERTEDFISGLVTNEKLTANDPTDYWSKVGILNIQQGTSQSQDDLVNLLSNKVGEELGFELNFESSNNNEYIYIDDGLYSGGQIIRDIKTWLENNTVSNIVINFICMSMHTAGIHRLGLNCGNILNRIKVERGISFKFWRFKQIDNWRNNKSLVSNETLWPTEIPNCDYYDNWLDSNPDNEEFIGLRSNDNVTGNGFFFSADTRNILEQAFLSKGAFIYSLPNDPNLKMRPLGYDALKGFGFGTITATYRNCPNNTPLVLWWGDVNAGRPLNHWHPLLPRRTRDNYININLDDF
jgi:hypothetical protein